VRIGAGVARFPAPVAEKRTLRRNSPGSVVQVGGRSPELPRPGPGSSGPTLSRDPAEPSRGYRFSRRTRTEGATVAVVPVTSTELAVTAMTLVPVADLLDATRCQRLTRLAAYVRTCQTEGLTLGQAAAIAGLERKYFSVYFRKRVRLSFSNWLMLVRVQTALDLLKAADVTVTEVALESGFGSLSACERAFRKVVAHPPRAVARHHRLSPGSGRQSRMGEWR